MYTIFTFFSIVPMQNLILRQVTHYHLSKTEG